MEIIFNKDASRLNDAMEGLFYCYKDNYTQLYKEYNLSLSKTSEEAFTYVKERISFDIPNPDLFFDKDFGIAMSFVRSRYSSRDLSIDNFIDYLTSLNADTVKKIALVSLKSTDENLNDDELTQIIESDDRLISFLKNSEIPSSIKWEIIEFFNDVSYYMNEFANLIKRYIPVYKKIYNKNKKNIEKFENYIEERINSEGEAYFTKLLDGAISIEANQIYVGTLFFNSRALALVTGEENKLQIYIGIDYEKTAEMALFNEDVIIGVLKNLSDKTRVQILDLLKNKKLYGQEISEQIGITMATVSYHMSYLLGFNLVKLEKVGQKGYYSLNKDTIRKSIEYLKSNFEL